jgi:hypothetical protein
MANARYLGDGSDASCIRPEAIRSVDRRRPTSTGSNLRPGRGGPGTHPGGGPSAQPARVAGHTLGVDPRPRQPPCRPAAPRGRGSAPAAPAADRRHQRALVPGARMRLTAGRRRGGSHSYPSRPRPPLNGVLDPPRPSPPDRHGGSAPARASGRPAPCARSAGSAAPAPPPPACRRSDWCGWTAGSRRRRRPPGGTEGTLSWAALLPAPSHGVGGHRP